MVIKMNPELMAATLENYQGNSFVSMKTMTTPKLNQKGRVSGKSVYEVTGVSAENIKKFSKFSCGIGAYEYRKMIERRLVKEGKDASAYEAGDTWHQARGDSKTIREHKKTGELYFFVFLVANNRSASVYVDMSSGRLIQKSLLVEFLPKESMPTNQGLELGNEVEVRTLKLESLKELKFQGNVYQM